mgnify:CR=1 FL=1|jgi:glutamine synthetase
MAASVELPDGIDTVIVATADIQGRLIGRRIPAENFAGAVEHGVAVSQCVFGWDIMQNSELLATGALDYTGIHNGMGDVVLMPDTSTLRVAAWLDSTAIVLADAVEVDGTATELAPRTVLQRQIAQLAAMGLTASVGTELEYSLFHGAPSELRADEYRTLDPTTTRPADYSILDGDALEPFLADQRRRLLAAGVEVEASQIEWGLGQIETTLVHTDPLRMADSHVVYKLAVRSHAAQRGMTASFMAKPTAEQPGNSCHIHLSLRNADGEPVFWSADDAHHVSEQLHHAIGGTLQRIPDVFAWYAPTVNSYRRTRAKDAAGWGCTWGIDHRFVSVRVVGNTPSSVRMEFRLAGADTNPYLALSALIASVIDGLEQRTDPGEPVVGSPFDLDVEETPRHLGAAVDHFASSAWTRSVFGDAVVEHHATLGRFEWDQFLDAVSDWDRIRYFDAI